MANSGIKVCSICVHPARAELEQRIMQGESAVAIAADTGCSRRQLLNHFGRGHVKKALAVAKAKERAGVMAAREAMLEERATDTGTAVANAAASYLNQANEILKATTAIFDEAMASGQQGLALAAAQKQMNAVSRCRELLELAAKVSGEFDAKSFNLYVLPEWQDICVFLVNILAPYPEARKAVIEGLKARVKRKSSETIPALEDGGSGDGGDAIETTAISGLDVVQSL